MPSITPHPAYTIDPIPYIQRLVLRTSSPDGPTHTAHPDTQPRRDSGSTAAAWPSAPSFFPCRQVHTEEAPLHRGGIQHCGYRHPGGSRLRLVAVMPAGLDLAGAVPYRGCTSTHHTHTETHTRTYTDTHIHTTLQRCTPSYATRTTSRQTSSPPKVVVSSHEGHVGGSPAPYAGRRRALDPLEARPGGDRRSNGERAMCVCVSWMSWVRLPKGEGASRKR